MRVEDSLLRPHAVPFPRAFRLQDGVVIHLDRLVQAPGGADQAFDQVIVEKQLLAGADLHHRHRLLLLLDFHRTMAPLPLHHLRVIGVRRVAVRHRHSEASAIPRPACSRSAGHGWYHVLRRPDEIGIPATGRPPALPLRPGLDR